MTGNICRFHNVSDMADFCAALTVKGIAFNTYSKGDEYVVEITGY
jgi:hypothetical protein